MFVHYSLRNNVSYKAIAMLVATALLTWSVAAQFKGMQAQAANVTDYSDLLSDSTSGSVSNHTIDLSLPNGLVTTETMAFTFDSGFDLTGLGADDIDVAFDGAATTSAAGAAGPGVFGVAFGGQDITFTSPTDNVASSTRLTFLIGTNATVDTVGDNQIVNPTATTTSHTIEVSTPQDGGRTHVAITDSVLVTAAVETTFDFTVLGTLQGHTIPGVATTTATNTSSSQLPFGTLTAGTAVTLAHQLTVETNARNGFNVTVEQSQDLQSSTGAIIDSFIDGTYENTPSAWQAPTGNITLNNTWGHWALTSDDDDYNASNDLWVAASTTPRSIFAHGSSADGATENVGSTTIGYIAEITSLQEAGNDYNTTLTYIATPTF